MNQRHLTVTIAAIVVLVGLSPMAGAQTATTAPAAVVLPQPLPAAVKSATPAAAIRQHLPVISDFVNGCIAGLEGDDGETQARARGLLIDAAWQNQNLASTVEFFDAYFGVLGPKLEAVLKHSKKLRVRVNAAIVLGRVAEPAAGANHRLISAVLAALADDSPAVVVWGVKAARATLAAERAVVGSAGQPRIPGAILAAMEKASVGEVAVEVFDQFRSGSSLPTSVLIPMAQRAIEIRAKLYSKAVPELPGIEASATTYLSAMTWKEQEKTPGEQVKSVQVMYDLLWAAAQARVREPANSDLKRVIEGTAGALQVVGGSLKDDGAVITAVTTAATAVVTASQHGQGGEQVVMLCGELGKSLLSAKSLKGFQLPATPATTRLAP